MHCLHYRLPALLTANTWKVASRKRPLPPAAAALRRVTPAAMRSLPPSMLERSGRTVASDGLRHGMTCKSVVLLPYASDIPMCTDTLPESTAGLQLAGVDAAHTVNTLYI